MPSFSTPAHVIIADDHPIVTLGVRAVLANHIDLNLVGTALCIDSLMRLLATERCDVLVCDYAFTESDQQDGLHLLRRIRRLYPEVKIILHTGHQRLSLLVHRVMGIGVSGFVSKCSGEIERLPDIIRAVRRGGRYLDPMTSAEMLRVQLSPEPSLSVLSERELEVFRLLGQGMSVTSIAALTNRSVKTVSTQKHRAMEKLGVDSDAALYRTYTEYFC